jgi:hypothetical protein
MNTFSYKIILKCHISETDESKLEQGHFLPAKQIHENYDWNLQGKEIIFVLSSNNLAHLFQ